MKHILTSEKFLYESDSYKTQEEWLEILHHKIQNEGFDYCFRHYSSWEEIQNEEFQKLRKEYVETSQKFENFINKLLADYENY